MIEGKRNSSVKESVLTVHTPMRSSGIRKQNSKAPISGKMSEERSVKIQNQPKLCTGKS